MSGQRASSPKDAELLTPAERQAIEMAGQLYTFIVADVIGDGRTRQADMRELAGHIHNIQHAVMSQAAARCYPQLYRLLGGTVGQEDQTGEAVAP